MRSSILVVATILVATSAQAAAKDSKARPHNDGHESSEEPNPKEAKERAAKKACLTGDPAKGVDLLTDLYLDTNDPTYIFNQGRCYEQSNQFENAIGRFREYLRKAKQANEADRNEAKAHISEGLRILGRKDTEGGGEPADSGQVAPPPVTALPVAPPPKASPEPLGVSAGPVVSAQPEQAGKGLRIAGWVTAGVGAAALVAGVVLNLEHNGTVKGLSDRYTADDESRAHTYKTMAIVGYGAGAACLVGGAVLYVLGWNAARVSVAPSVGVGDAGAVLAGRF